MFHIFGKPVRTRVKYLSALATSLILLSIWFALTSNLVVRVIPFLVLLPSPVQVIEAWTNQIGPAIVATSVRVWLGLLLGSAIGVGGAILLSWSAVADAAFDKLIEAWRPVPPVALIPFLLVFFGFSEAARILLIVLSAALVIVVSAKEAIANVRPNLVKAAYTLGADDFTVLRRVILPAIMPELTAGLRIALAWTMGVAVIAEFMGAETGLGYLLNLAKTTNSLDMVLLLVFVIGILSTVFDAVIRTVMADVTKWAPKSLEALR